MAKPRLGEAKRLLRPYSKISGHLKFTPRPESGMQAFLGTWRGFQEVLARGGGSWAPGTLYLTLFHNRLLSTLGAVARHDASAKVLAVPSTLLHGVGLRVVAPAMAWGPALGQAELPAEGTVLLLHLAHTHLQALTLPLTGGRVPGTVRLGFQRRQRHWLPI